MTSGLNIGPVDKRDVRRYEMTSAFYSSCSCTLASWDTDLTDEKFCLISDVVSGLSSS